MWSCVISNLDLSRCVRDGALLLNVLCSGANSGNENSVAMPWRQQLFIHFDYLYRLRIREDQLWMLGEVNESNQKRVEPFILLICDKKLGA